MFGGSSGHYIAGSGTSYLEGSVNTTLESTTGDTYFSLSNGGTIISGAGNDYNAAYQLGTDWQMQPYSVPFF